MDNLTHSLVGLAAAKSGLERLSPGATALCVLAANAPDADIAVLLFSDRWGFLEHHRGITHAIVGTIALGVLLPLLFYLGDLLLTKLRRRPPLVNFRGLLLASLLVSATHPILDWTNNYGVRFLLPWDSRWFYGDFVFIVDPFIWLMLGGACFLLSKKTTASRATWLFASALLTALIFLSARGGNLPQPWLLRAVWISAILIVLILYLRGVGEKLGPKVAWSSLILLVVYWSSLAFAHSVALRRAGEESATFAASDESISRLAAMPTLANPFRWDCVAETNKATYKFNLNLMIDEAVTKLVRYERPSGQLDRALREVSDDRRTRVFLGFARFPVARLSTQDCTAQTLVQLADLRYTEPGMQRGSFSLELPVDCGSGLTVNR
jgi:inner membrane protein